MDISRHGAYRNHGEKSILSSVSLAVGNNYGSMYRDNVRWDKEHHRIIIKSKATSDPISDSKYRYTIKLSLNDISNLINILGQAASQDNAAVLRDSLGKHLPAIIRLLSCAAGFVPINIPEKE
ncbi:hypothetical protein [Gimesia chilikensis]|uniref:hypothetical protein n=1 Tax=Gimesia chilikensis TaxID=2605989 RepID=UPI003A950479